MNYTDNEIVCMNEQQFVHTFKSRQAIVRMKDGNELSGCITDVHLAVNINISTNDHLPVGIIISGRKVPIFQIASINVLP